jgi:hypothetical protein
LVNNNGWFKPSFRITAAGQTPSIRLKRTSSIRSGTAKGASIHKPFLLCN